MPLTLIYGAAPDRLSRWVSHHIADWPHADGAFTWLVATPQAVSRCDTLLRATDVGPQPDTCILPLSQWLQTRCEPFLTDRSALDWLETLHVLKRILGEDRALPSLDYAARTLLRAKANLAFVQQSKLSSRTVPPFLTKA